MIRLFLSLILLSSFSQAYTIGSLFKDRRKENLPEADHGFVTAKSANLLSRTEDNSLLSLLDSTTPQGPDDSSSLQERDSHHWITVEAGNFTLRFDGSSLHLNDILENVAGNDGRMKNMTISDYIQEAKSVDAAERIAMLERTIREDFDSISGTCLEKRGWFPNATYWEGLIQITVAKACGGASTALIANVAFNVLTSRPAVTVDMIPNVVTTGSTQLVYGFLEFVKRKGMFNEIALVASTVWAKLMCQKIKEVEADAKQGEADIENQLACVRKEANNGMTIEAMTNFANAVNNQKEWEEPGILEGWDESEQSEELEELEEPKGFRKPDDVWGTWQSTFDLQVNSNGQFIRAPKRILACPSPRTSRGDDHKRFRNSQLDHVFS